VKRGAQWGVTAGIVAARRRSPGQSRPLLPVPASGSRRRISGGEPPPAIPCGCRLSRPGAVVNLWATWCTPCEAGCRKSSDSAGLGPEDCGWWR
jgi:hypothetical protein